MSLVAHAELIYLTNILPEVYSVSKYVFFFLSHILFVNGVGFSVLGVGGVRGGWMEGHRLQHL